LAVHYGLILGVADESRISGFTASLAQSCFAIRVVKNAVAAADWLATPALAGESGFKPTRITLVSDHGFPFVFPVIWSHPSHASSKVAISSAM